VNGSMRPEAGKSCRARDGFKCTRVDFQDLLYQTIRTPGTAGSQGTAIPTRERPRER
jgi:hypothetical protein